MIIASRRALRCTTAIVGVLSAMFVAGGAFAQEPTYSFNIPAEPLSKALRDFAQTTHQQLVFTETMTGGKAAPAISGSLGAAAALRYILANSGLMAERTPTGAWVIRARGDVGGSQSANNAIAQADSQGGQSSEDVVVTAERRSERLQDVPFSVTPVTAKQLQQSRIDSTRDLALVTPGLRIEAIGPFVEPSIRGVSTVLSGSQTEPNVATYVDSVYQPSVLSAVYSLPDVEQIEVLKGPQGTLFGRNATGGAILINTNAPNLDRATGDLRAGYSSFGTEDFSAFLSGPIIQDRLAASVTGYYNAMTDGYQHNLVPDGHRANTEQYLIRAKIRFVPWEGADFILIGLYDHLDDYSTLAFTSLNGNALGASYVTARRLPFASGPFDYAFDTIPYVHLAEKSIALRGTSEAGPGTVTTTTSYIVRNSALLTDLDNTLAPGGYIATTEQIQALSQELIYSTHQLGRFRGTVGAFYYTSDATENPLTIVPYFSQYADIKDWSYALFGDADVDLTKQLSIEGGVRLSEETQRAYWTGAPTTPGGPPHPLPVGAPNPGEPLVGSHTWKAATPRVSLKYKVTGETNLYFTYSQGFKSGAYNSSGFVETTPVSPEAITAYEAGFKSALTPRFDLNGAFFYYQYNNLQIDVFEGGTEFLENAAKAEIRGVEFSGDWRPTDNFTLNFGATYLDAHYTHFIKTQVEAPMPGGGNTTITESLSGNAMIRAPTFSGNLTVNYSWDTALGNLDASGTLYYSTKVFYDVADRIQQPAYTVLNATLAWRPAAAKNVTVTFWAKNLMGSVYLSNTTITAGGDEAVFAPPRAFGGEVRYQF